MAPRESTGLQPISPTDGVELNALDRAGTPYLAWKDEAGRLMSLRLTPDHERYGIGRHPGCDVCLTWDEEISRAHAQVVRVSGQWAIEDDGLSTNGTFLNSDRVVSKRRLSHGDQVRVGSLTIEYRDSSDEQTGTTRKAGGGSSGLDRLSPAHRRVLAALARALRDKPSGTPAPTNARLAEALTLGEETVKSHLARIYELLAVSGSNAERRAELARRALEWGLDLSER